MCRAKGAISTESGEKRFYSSVAMYLRKSRAEENEDTASVLARHRSQLERFAKERGINCTGVYEEVVSGDSLFCRPRMLELLNDIEAGRYTGVLCTDIDRLGRGSMKDQGLVLETLKDADAAIITPEKLYDLNDELDETQGEFRSFMARQELKLIKKRLARGIRLTVEKGGYVSNVPFGYRRAYAGKTPTLAPEPAEAEAVRLIFSLYLAGDGAKTISRKLAEMGVRPRRGDVFSRNSIRKIISNPVYTGKIVWGQKKHLRPKKPGEKYRTVPSAQGIEVEGLHPAIVDRATFERANAALRGRRHPPCSEGRVANPLAGLLFCRRCGRAMAYRTFGGRKYQADRFICPTAGCMTSSRADSVERAVVFALRKTLAGRSLPNTVAREEPAEAVEKGMRAQLLRLEGQRGRLCDLLEQGAYSTELFMERKSKLDARVSAISADLSALGAREKLEKKGPDAPPEPHDIFEGYFCLSPGEKNRFLKSLIDRALYYKKKGAVPDGFVLEISLKDFGA